MARQCRWAAVMLLVCAAAAAADEPAIVYEDGYDYTKVLVSFGAGRVALSNDPRAVPMLKQFRDDYVAAYAMPVGMLQVQAVDDAGRLKREATRQKVGFVLSAVIEEFTYSDALFRYRITQRMEVRERNRWRVLFSNVAIQGGQQGNPPRVIGRPPRYQAPQAPRENPAAKPFLMEVLPIEVVSAQQVRNRTIVNATVRNLLPFAVTGCSADLMLDRGDGTTLPTFASCELTAPMELALQPGGQMAVGFHAFAARTPPGWKAERLVASAVEPLTLAGLEHPVDGEPHLFYFDALARHLQLKLAPRQKFDQIVAPFQTQLQEAHTAAQTKRAALIESLDKAAMSASFEVRRDAAELIWTHYQDHYEAIINGAFEAILPMLDPLEQGSAGRWRERTAAQAAEAFARGRLAAAPGDLPAAPGSGPGAQVVVIEADCTPRYVAGPTRPGAPGTVSGPSALPSPAAVQVAAAAAAVAAAAGAPAADTSPRDPLIAEADALEAEALAAEQAKDYEKAIELYDLYVRKYFRKTPRFEQVRLRVDALRTDERVQVLIQLKRLNAAAEKQYKLAEIFYTSGKPDEAKQRLELLIKTFPESRWAVEARKLLEKIEQDAQ